jgi:hypothetical protein
VHRLWRRTAVLAERRKPAAIFRNPREHPFGMVDAEPARTLGYCGAPSATPYREGLGSKGTRCVLANGVQGLDHELQPATLLEANAAFGLAKVLRRSRYSVFGAGRMDE